MTREKLMERLAKIKRHQESAAKIGSLAEANAFAAKLQGLLDQHKLGMDDIEFDAFIADEPVEEEVVEGADYGYGDRRARVPWTEKLAGVIARSHGCTILVWTGMNRISFVGRKSDRAVAVYLFSTLVPELERMSKRMHRAEKKEYGWLPSNWRRSWLMGAVRGIKRQLQEQQEATRADAQATGNGTALVRLDSSKEALAEFVSRRCPGNARARGVGGRLDSAAYCDGEAHGRSMSVKRGIDGAGQQQLRSG